MHKIIAVFIGILIIALLPASKVNAQSADYCVKVPILFYHHIQPYKDAVKKHQTSLTVDTAFFEKQMSYLSEKGFTSYSATEFVNDFLARKQFPEKSVVITLDDGYKDALTSALPIAQKYGMKLNLMIPTGLLENTGYLTWTDLKDMIKSGSVFAYNHTWSHYSLNYGTVEHMRSEISTAQNALKDQLGNVDGIITYPYGGFNNKVIDEVQKLGFRAAFTIKPGKTECFSNILSLPRVRIGNAPLSSYGL